MTNLFTLIPQRVRSVVRRALLGGVPDRLRLATVMLMERLMGRMDEELRVLPTLAISKEMAVDIGANNGFYSYAMSKSFKRVVAFEPNEEVIRNLVRCGARNITIHTCALSSAPGTRELYIPLAAGMDLSGWASLERAHLPERDGVSVLYASVRRLDDFNLDGVSLIKIDVEGHEVDVLEGSRRTIEANRPTVLIEIARVNRSKVAAYFGGISYSPHIVSDGRLLPLPEGIERYDGPKYNFVFMPTRAATKPREIAESG